MFHSRLITRAIGGSTGQFCKRLRLYPRVSRKLGYATVANTDLENVDVVIVGGGPVGLALACALSSFQSVRETLRIALVEGGDLSRVRNWSPESDQYSNRVVSITNASRLFLKDIGVWDHVEVSRTSPIEEMQANARITFLSSDLPLATNGLKPEMARLTENLNVQRGLLRCLESYPDVSVIDKTKVDSIVREEREGGGWPIVHLSNGKKLRARLLVGADGFNSPVRSYAKISSFGWSYDTQAIVASLSHSPRTSTSFQSSNTTAYQRFLPTGPIAFLPLSASVSSLVWSTTPPLAAALLKSDMTVLSTMVNAAFRLPEISIKYLSDLILESHENGVPLTGKEVLDEVRWREISHGINVESAYSSCYTESVGIPPLDAEMLPPKVASVQNGTAASFSVRFNHADTYAGEGDGARTVLVGDAAHTAHPLAGQGLNLGIADVQSLARCIDMALHQGGDIGSYTSLLPYTQDRYFENHKIMSITDKLHKLYRSTLGPVVWSRSIGLEVLNELSLVKGAFMSSAGAQPTNIHKSNNSAWNVVAGSVEALAGGFDMGKLLLKGVAGSTINNVSQFLKR
ncbi:ubiquinone biosynthesis hydrox [Hysterangium stoloniferum]|nr:ubiquinone biosynthesis hydrox [Hysterangium stoloniferum]